MGILLPQPEILRCSYTYPQMPQPQLRSSDPHPDILILRSSASDPEDPQLRILSLRSSDPRTFTSSDSQILILKSLSLGSSDPQILTCSDPQIHILRSLTLTSSDPQTLTSVTCHAVLCYAHVSPPRLVGITLPTDTPLRVVDAHGMLCCVAVCVTGCLAGCLSASLSLSLAVCPSVYPVPHVT